MKIAINCIYYTPKGGGITEYIFNLLREISKKEHHHDFIIYTTKEAENEIKSVVNQSFKIKVFPYSEHQKIKRSIFQQGFWSKEEEQEHFDIFHSPFFHSPKFKRAKIVLTVHDLRFLNYPSSYKFFRLIYLKIVVGKSIKRASHIIAISGFTKKEIIKHYNVEELEIDVVYEAVDKNGFELKSNKDSITIKNCFIESKKYILAVGHLEPRKNYLYLVQAYSKLSDKLRNSYSLVIVGKKNHDYSKILNRIETAEKVIYLDFVSREELTWLYANCMAHVFPSYYEGFGFPILEAGLFGKPTIGSKESSIPEIAGSGGIYFDPFSVDDISKKISIMLSDKELHSKTTEYAYMNVEKYSWSRNAAETLSIYNQIIECKEK